MADSKAILREGRNCWRIARAARAALLIDGARYFRALRDALEMAQHSITVMGWDFDGDIKLCLDDRDCPSLGQLLRRLVEERPELEVRILIWSVAVFHAPGSPLPLLLGSEWERHPRIQLRLDRKHPFYASHHAKVVCIDGTLAFVGGMDLTVGRWDTCEHLNPSEVRLSERSGKAYGPVHDVQMMVDGDAARAVTDYARERWRYVIGETIPPYRGETDVWPADVKPDFTDIDVAVARTLAPYDGRPGVYESATLVHDALRSARKLIYIEAQYVTSPHIRRILERHLHREDGPEIVMVVRKVFDGWFEGLVMGHSQDRLINRLHRADRYHKFGAYYKAVGAADGNEECAVNVHSKAIVVDDSFLRIGSSNLNNRSLGLDSECDLAIEAGSETHRLAIAHARNMLIGEHMGVAAETVARAFAQEGSMLEAVAVLNCNDARLRPLKRRRLSAKVGFLTTLLDPAGPIDPIGFLQGRRGGWKLAR